MDKLIQARYKGRCAECGMAIDAGAWVLWNAQTRAVRHQDAERECGVEGQRRAYRDAAASASQRAIRRQNEMERSSKERRETERKQKELQDAAAALMAAQTNGDQEAIDRAYSRARLAMRALNIM